MYRDPFTSLEILKPSEYTIEERLINTPLKTFFIVLEVEKGT